MPAHHFEIPLPTDFDMMMSLFTSRSSLKDVPIYPVRGNHDCYHNDIFSEVKLRERYPNWKMENLFYEKRFGLGGGNEVALLMVDSCLLICNAYLKNNSMLLDAETAGI